jgi:Mn2+/Fe2+ NRAMP family transporter
MLILLISSLAALVLVLKEGPAGDLSTGIAIEYDFVTFGFILALMGWMPIPLDASVWHSFWALEYQKDTDVDHKTGINVPESDRFLLKDGLKDFNVGFILAAVLAVLFMVLGAYVMFGTSLEFSNSGAVFADQLMQLYTQSLGHWSYPIIATAAFTTMFSTTLTVIDSSPRVWKGFAEIFRERKPAIKRLDMLQPERIYILSMLIIALGAVLIQLFFLQAFKALIDLATTLSFLTAPILAFMNYKVMLHSSIPEAAKWGVNMRRLAVISIILLTLFSLIYLGWLFL